MVSRASLSFASRAMQLRLLGGGGRLLLLELHLRPPERVLRLAELVAGRAELFRLGRLESGPGLLRVLLGLERPGLRLGQESLAVRDDRQIDRARSLRVLVEGLLGPLQGDVRFVQVGWIEARGNSVLRVEVIRARVGERLGRHSLSCAPGREQRGGNGPNDGVLPVHE